MSVQHVAVLQYFGVKQIIFLQRKEELLIIHFWDSEMIICCRMRQLACQCGCRPSCPESVPGCEGAISSPGVATVTRALWTLSRHASCYSRVDGRGHCQRSRRIRTMFFKVCRGTDRECSSALVWRDSQRNNRPTDRQIIGCARSPPHWAQWAFNGSGRKGWNAWHDWSDAETKLRLTFVFLWWNEGRRIPDVSVGW